MTHSRLVIAGAGGFGRELIGQVKTSPRFIAERKIDDFVFIDDFARAKCIQSDFAGTIEEFEPGPADVVIVAIGDPKTRKKVVQRLSAKKAVFESFVHDHAYVGPRVNLGEGVIVCVGAKLTTDITLGNFSIVNVGAVIGHDAIVGSISTIGPNSNLTGGVQIGHEVFVGASAVIRPSVSIGNHCMVGMGSVVTRDVSEGATVFGNPASQITPTT